MRHSKLLEGQTNITHQEAVLHCSFQNPLSFNPSTQEQEKTERSEGVHTMGGLTTQNSSSAISLSVQKEQSPGVAASGPDSKPRKKICCACPETKKLRDECVVEHGEAACEKWIEAHRKCLRAEGFNV